MGRGTGPAAPRDNSSVTKALVLLLLVPGCAHHEVALNTGASVVSTRANVQVDASGGVAAALVAAGLVAATVHDLKAPRAPEMDPTRSVNEQDCSQPIAGSGNLRCR